MKAEELKVGDVFKGKYFHQLWLVLDKYTPDEELRILAISAAGFQYTFNFNGLNVEVRTEAEFLREEYDYDLSIRLRC